MMILITPERNSYWKLTSLTLFTLKVTTDICNDSFVSGYSWFSVKPFCHTPPLEYANIRWPRLRPEGEIFSASVGYFLKMNEWLQRF